MVFENFRNTAQHNLDLDKLTATFICPGTTWGSDTSHQTSSRNSKMTEPLCSTFICRSVTASCVFLTWPLTALHFLSFLNFFWNKIWNIYPSRFIWCEFVFRCLLNCNNLKKKQPHNIEPIFGIIYKRSGTWNTEEEGVQDLYWNQPPVGEWDGSSSILA